MKSAPWAKDLDRPSEGQLPGQRGVRDRLSADLLALPAAYALGNCDGCSDPIGVLKRDPPFFGFQTMPDPSVKPFLFVPI
jgi:hypothetical protein